MDNNNEGVVGGEIVTDEERIESSQLNQDTINLENAEHTTGNDSEQNTLNRFDKVKSELEVGVCRLINVVNLIDGTSTTLNISNKNPMEGKAENETVIDLFSESIFKNKAVNVIGGDGLDGSPLCLMLINLNKTGENNFDNIRTVVGCTVVSEINRISKETLSTMIYMNNGIFPIIKYVNIMDNVEITLNIQKKSVELTENEIVLEDGQLDEYFEIEPSTYKDLYVLLQDMHDIQLVVKVR